MSSSAGRSHAAQQSSFTLRQAREQQQDSMDNKVSRSQLQQAVIVQHGELYSFSPISEPGAG
jgi:hypothetical protein